MKIPAAVKDVLTLDFVPKEEAERRLAICRACDRYLPGTTQCGICFCIMPAKVKLTSSECADLPPKW